QSWPIAVGHAPWVEEVWSNYISNAVKYGGEPPQITIGAEQEKNYVRFYVHDNGPGLDAQARSRLFAAGTRLAQHRALKGHGLGLSIVRRIVERLGGEVGVESEPGQGSTFYFTLPIAQN
ncbi:MAG: ATP-binding protein, partial [Chloroflexi bacterium]